MLPADAAGGEEEPVHEDAGAVVVGVIGQHAVPLVLLLTRAVPGAPECALLGADLLKTKSIYSRGTLSTLFGGQHNLNQLIYVFN